MELHFESSPCKSLKRMLGEVRNLEQAQEIRLTDGMPDIGRVLCGWGQILQRSKEWSGDSVSLTAGMMVWVLYAPEDGGGPRCVESWIPFSVQWDLPETAPQGTLRIQCQVRFVDARSVSARKIMVRCGIGAMAEAYCPWEWQIYAPQEEPEQVQLKKVRYPVRIPVEAGEKTFSLEEALTLPQSMSPMEKLIYYTLEPEILEQRCLGDKIAFKGSARLHILYADSEEKLHSWEEAVPFQQFAQLEESRTQEAEVSVCCAVTALEAEVTDEMQLTLRCSLAGQYVAEDRQLLELIEDAYSPGRELEAEGETLELQRILESRRETVSAECSIPGGGEQSVDVTFCPDFPRQRVLEDRITEELSGQFQVLYYGADGTLSSGISRWEGEYTLPADRKVQLTAVPLSPAEPQILMGGGDMKLRTELPLQLTTEAAEGISVVTGLTLGDPVPPDENRPSLILRRAGDRDLWEIAKASGSTVAAIQEANHLEDAPSPAQMLLIPIL